MVWGNQMYVSWGFWKRSKLHRALSFLLHLLHSSNADIILRCSVVMYERQQNRNVKWAWPGSHCTGPETTTSILFARKNKPLICLIVSKFLSLSVKAIPRRECRSRNTNIVQTSLGFIHIKLFALFLDERERRASGLHCNHLTHEEEDSFGVPSLWWQRWN